MHCLYIENMCEHVVSATVLSVRQRYAYDLTLNIWPINIMHAIHYTDSGIAAAVQLSVIHAVLSCVTSAPWDPAACKQITLST